MALVALLAGMSVGCVTSDRVALGTSLAALACDIGQTAQSADAGWKYSTEVNPIIHDRGPAAIVAYGVASAAVITTVWYLLPRGWRTMFGAGVTWAEAGAVGYSYKREHVCFGKGEYER